MEPIEGIAAGDAAVDEVVADPADVGPIAKARQPPVHVGEQFGVVGVRVQEGQDLVESQDLLSGGESGRAEAPEGRSVLSGTSRALAIWRANASVTSRGSGPRAMRCARSSPGTISMTRRFTPSAACSP
jgi:hypothetical protein